MKRKICCVLGHRANYSSIKSVLLAIKKKSDLTLQIILISSAILEKYGSIRKILKSDGLNVNLELPILLEGETPQTMAKTTGLGLIELSTAFSFLRPDIVIVVGDRFETMSTTLAAAYNNIIIAHTMGGELSGTIDESIRHAITKFAHIHFPANSDATRRIIKMGENPKFVFNTGCPRIDIVKDIMNKKKKFNLDYLNKEGVGDKINFNKNFIILSQHPVTTEYGDAFDQITLTLNAISSLDFQTIILWPNPDAGSDDIAKGIRRFRENNSLKKIRFIKNVPLETYIILMSKTKCLVGNSSSGIREGAYIGTPVVNIGSRQNNRARGKNVLDVKHNIKEISNAIKKQVKHGFYKSEMLYGDGNAGIKIARILNKIDVKVQKTNNY